MAAKSRGPWLLGIFSAFGPLSMDFYLPGLPALTDDLGSSRPVGQLTLSACMLGLAIGQLVMGPVSDRWGRVRTMRLSVSVFAGISLLCAVAPSMAVLIALRFVQGFAGGMGIVTARAMVQDLYGPSRSAAVYSTLLTVTGAVPVLAPLLGGALLPYVGWRGIFLALAVVGAGLTWSTRWIDTSPGVSADAAPRRRVGQDIGATLRDSRFIAFSVSLGASHCCLFAYILMSPYVFGTSEALGPRTFSYVFAFNGLALVLTSRANIALLPRWSPRVLMTGGLAIAIAGAILVWWAAAASAPTALVLVPLAVVVSCTGLIAPNAMALGLRDHTARAGTAAGLMGVTQFGAGAVVVPLASTAGVTAETMATTMLGALIVACGALALSERIQPRGDAV